MAQRRRYTKREKAEAVAVASLGSTEAAADQLGIPRKTIAYWMDKPEFAELRQKTSDFVAESMWVAMQVGVKRIVELIPQTDDIAKVGVAVGILYDKRALMTGQATQRTETHDWKLDDYETVERAAAVVVEELARRTDEGAAQAAVGPAGETGATSTEG